MSSRLGRRVTRAILGSVCGWGIRFEGSRVSFGGAAAVPSRPLLLFVDGSPAGFGSGTGVGAISRVGRGAAAVGFASSSAWYALATSASYSMGEPGAAAADFSCPRFIPTPLVVRSELED